MSPKRATWMALGVLLALGPLARGAALACSCAPPNRADQVAHAAAIFVGEVIAAPEAPRDRSSPGAEALRYRFRVEESLKGGVAATVDVATPASPAACGTSFATGERYLVFARERGGSLETGLCDFDVSGDDLEPTRAEVRRLLAP
jgi:hypothetical protein